ncbi:MAG: hypothetical protein K2H66_01680, partial [Oscillospiraceae bacterium]|nr:hypothetical protein [Oscillospiraceae bacterium]
VTRVVLIFLLLLVIIALLVAAFMSLGNGTVGDSGNTIPVAQIPTDENGETVPTSEVSTTIDPNHNAPTETIPEEILNPTSENEIDFSGEPADNTGETQEPVQTLVLEGDNIPKMTTTGERPANTTPVYISTGDTGLATLAPPLTTAGYENNSGLTTITTTVAQAGDGTITSVNYTVSLSGSAGIYSEPNGGSNGTIGSNGTFTIIQEQTDSNGVKWGKLKSGAGWVRLN